jgi:hypothetical protein
MTEYLGSLTESVYYAGDLPLFFVNKGDIAFLDVGRGKEDHRSFHRYYSAIGQRTGSYVPEIATPYQACQLSGDVLIVLPLPSATWNSYLPSALERYRNWTLLDKGFSVPVIYVLGDAHQ